MDKSYADLRREYADQPFSEESADPNPYEQFRAWFNQAVNADIREPNGMALATVAADGRPSARTVLLKGFDEQGFVFYTNYESRKGQELAANPLAALLFWWPELERQVRIEGRVEQVGADESDAYFSARPWEARLGAWASPQSRVLAGRGELEARIMEMLGRFADQEIPRPPHWGGYRVVPEAFEFWQGRQSRLHDRLHYRPAPGGGWQIDRLSP